MEILKARTPIRVRAHAHRVQRRVELGIKGCALPAPKHVELQVLRRYGYVEGTWIGAGTFVGDTTAKLARRASKVFTTEPIPAIAGVAGVRFRGNPRVEVLEGPSGDLLAPLCRSVSDPVSFWLDGHASGGPTFRGPQVTPVRKELVTIGDNLGRWDRVSVMADDVRGFSSTTQTAKHNPPKSELVS